MCFGATCIMKKKKKGNVSRILERHITSFKRKTYRKKSFLNDKIINCFENLFAEMFIYLKM